MDFITLHKESFHIFLNANNSTNFSFSVSHFVIFSDLMHKYHQLSYPIAVSIHLRTEIPMKFVSPIFSNISSAISESEYVKFSRETVWS